MLFLLIASITLAVAATFDGISTVFALGRGGEEQNPLFGKHPSGLRVFVQGTLLIAAEIGLSWLLYSYRPVVGDIAGACMLIQSGFHIFFGCRNFRAK
jgi:hypothetical protein